MFRSACRTPNLKRKTPNVILNGLEYAQLSTDSLSGDELDIAILLSRLEENTPVFKKCLISFIHPRTTDRKVISGVLLSFSNRTITIKSCSAAKLFGEKNILPDIIYTIPFSKVLSPKITHQTFRRGDIATIPSSKIILAAT